MTTAPHGSRRAGFSFAPGVFRGLFAVCLICHFNAPVRRFNYGCYPYIAAVLRALYALFAPLCGGVIRCSVACRRPCVPVVLSMAGPDRWRSLCGCRFGSLHAGRPGAAMARLSAKVAVVIVAGKVAKVAGIVVRFCAKVATKVARFTPKS
jgi:hypothetical protein